MTLTDAAGLNLGALSEELGDVDLVLASYGVESEAIEALAYEVSGDTTKRLIAQLMGHMDAGEIRSDFAALYTAGVLMGLSLAREIDAPANAPSHDPRKG